MGKISTFLFLGAMAAILPATAAMLPVDSRLQPKLSSKQLMHDSWRQLSQELPSPARINSAVNVITEVNGTPKFYSKSISGNIYYEDYDRSDMGALLVFGDDNDVYFYNIISDAGLPSYVKGEISDDAITLALPQWLDYYDTFGYGYLLQIGRYNPSTLSFDPQDIDTLTFSIDEDGYISMELPADDDYILGIFDSEDGTWLEIGDYFQQYAPSTEEITLMPDGLETETYCYIEDSYGYTVEVAFDNDKLYISGLIDGVPSYYTISATVEGNKATLDTNKICGEFAGYWLYPVCVAISSVDPEYLDFELVTDGVYTFDIDTVNRVIKPSEGQDTYLCINASLDELFYLSIYLDYELKQQDNFAGTPRNPSSLYYGDDYLDWYGYWSFMFDISNISTEGNLLDHNSLYYRIYVNGELYEFKEDAANLVYLGIGESAFDIPMDFNNYNDFYSYSAISKEVGIYEANVATIGVQLVNRYEGTETESEIVTLNVKTGEVTTGDSGVESISAADVVSTQYFNTAGQRVSNPDKGIFIKRTVMSDGTVKVMKVAR